MLAIAGLLVAGCTRLSAPVAPVDHQLVKEILQQPLPADPGPDRGGHTWQLGMLEDGRATWTEYEAAVARSVECMREAGFQIQFPGESNVRSSNVDGRYILTFEAVDVEDDELWDRTELPCRSQWSWYLEQVWIQQMVKQSVGDGPDRQQPQRRG